MMHEDDGIGNPESKQFGHLQNVSHKDKGQRDLSADAPSNPDNRSSILFLFLG